MFTRLITACAVSVTLAFSSVAFAASTNFIDNGSYTTDTISGLDWYDLTQTTNRSYTDVSGKLGTGEEFEGWQYATGSQFVQLVNNATDTATTSNNYGQVTYTNPVKLRALITLLGMTASPFEGYERSFGLLGDTQGSKVWNAVLAVFLLAESYTSKAHNQEVEQVTVSGFTGSFLVRDTLFTDPNPSAVPIPAAAFMFAPALLGFLGLRRKAKNLAA
jgi:hypothetical protein